MKEKHQKYLFLSIFIFCVLLRVIYIAVTTITERGMQNDIGLLDDSCYGHLGYIYYLANGGDLIHNGAGIHYQFYHPPLHYIICAVFLKMLTLLGVPLQTAGECLQVLPLFYSVMVLVFIDKIVKRLGGDYPARIMALCLAGFFPYAVFLAGAMNNDGLLTLLMVMTIYYLIIYYEKPSVRSVLPLALCFGGALMTKISALLLLPGIVFLLGYQYYKNKKLRMGFIDQYVIFSLVSGVIGLWYPCKNYVIYHMNFLFVPNLGPDSPQYLGDFPLLPRFIDFDFNQLKSLGVVFREADGMLDHNIFLSLLKYSVFAESRYYVVAETLCRILFFLFGAMLLLIFVSAICFLIKGSCKKEYRIVTGIIYATVMLSYFRFCLTHPHVCTMHVRYIMTGVFLILICAALGFSAKKERVRTWISGGFTLAYSVVALCFVFVYFLF